MFNNKAKRHHLRNRNYCRVDVSPSTGIIPQKNYGKQETTAKEKVIGFLAWAVIVDVIVYLVRR